MLKQDGKIDIPITFPTTFSNVSVEDSLRNLKMTMKESHGFLQLINKTTSEILSEIGLSPNELYPYKNNATSLGTASKRFKDGYFAGALAIPSYTNTTRPATGTNGNIIHNAETNRLNWYFGSNWSDQMGKFISPPASSTANGFKGDFSADANYFYVCYDTHKWIRVAKDAW